MQQTEKPKEIAKQQVTEANTKDLVLTQNKIETFPIELGDGVFASEKIKICSWDIGGLRSSFRYESVINYINADQFDIICIQELKMDQAAFVADLAIEKFPKNYHNYFAFCCAKTSYGGSAVLSKVKPIKVDFEIPNHKHNPEGRVITLEFEKFIVVAVNVPTSGEKLVRLDYRTKVWDTDLREYLKQLKEKNKIVIVCGNFNVAHQEIDLSQPATSMKLPGFTPQERRSFLQLLRDGWVDTFRSLNPMGIQYTYQKNRFHKKQDVQGWRVDYALISKEHKQAVSQSLINSAVEGSDHAPIEIIIENK